MNNIIFSDLLRGAIQDAGLRPRLNFGEAEELSLALIGIGDTILNTERKLRFLADAFTLFTEFEPELHPMEWVLDDFRDVAARAQYAPMSAAGCVELMADIEAVIGLRNCRIAMQLRASK